MKLPFSLFPQNNKQKQAHNKGNQTHWDSIIIKEKQQKHQKIE